MTEDGSGFGLVAFRVSGLDGVGAGTGVLVGILTKFILGCVICLLITIAAFWP